MILDPQAANDRLNSEDNLANKVAQFRKERKSSRIESFEGEDGKTHTIEHRETEPAKKLPRLTPQAKEEVRAAASSGLETQAEIADRFGISQGAVTYLKKTAQISNETFEESDPTDSPDPVDSYNPRPKNRKRSIREAALDKLMLTMGLINDDSLEGVKAKDLSTIASNLSRVVETVSPKTAQQAMVNLVVYTPKINDESKYKIVEVRAE